MYESLEMQLIRRIGSGWTTLKFIRVILGVLILVSSIQEGHTGGIILGTVFTLIAFLTDGVCGIGGACYTPPAQKTDLKKLNDIDYEELGTRQ